MLSKKTMDSLAAMTGISADVLAKAISDEQEKDLELPQGEFLTQDQKDKLLDNHGKRKYDEGVSKANKDAFDGGSKEDFIKGIKDAALEEAKVEPNKKIVELNQSIENLRTKLSEQETKYSSLESSVETERTRLKAQSFIPDLPDNIGLKKAEAAELLLKGVEFKDDGIYKDGNLVKDNMEKALTLEDFIKNSANERGWYEAPKGRGGGSGGSGGGSNGTPKSLEEYESLIKAKGIHPGSEEAQSLLAKAAQENTEFYGENS